jgi:vacuolar-type H+-ATPase subunit F/Vma7
MELSVRILCSAEVAAGFDLAGVAVDQADETSAGDALLRLATDATTGIVLVEDRLHRSLPADLVQRLDRRAIPVVVPFPSPSWGGVRVADEYVLEILRQAVGYRVRPR